MGDGTVEKEDMNLSQLQREVGVWARRNFPKEKPYQPLLGIGEETGELMHAHLKMEQKIRGKAEEHQEAKEDAVGDILIFLAHYCELNDINLSWAVEKTWREVKQRDWRKHKRTGKK